MQTEVTPETQTSLSPAVHGPLGLRHRITELEKLTTAELRDELKNAFKITGEHMLYLAAIWKLLEARGEDLSELRANLEGLAFYIPRIAKGEVDAAAIARFANKGALVRAVAVLPLSEQQRLAAGEPVAVCVRSRGSQEIDEVPMDPLALSGPQIHQVFGPRGIRSAEEQRESLLMRRDRLSGKNQPIEYDPELQAINVGKIQIPTRRISQAIAKTSHPAAVQADKRTPVSIPEKLHKALRARAAQMGLTLEDVLVQALHAFGIAE